MISFQLLDFSVQVSVEDRRLEPVLDYLANGARQAWAPVASLHFEVSGRGPYELFENGRPLAMALRPDDVLYILYGHCYARTTDALAVGGWVPIHAGLVSVEGRRALVIGEKGAGKTTLLLRLVHDGHGVEGDEIVFTQSGEAICLPRNFHVKPGAIGLVPELAPGWAALPATSTTDGTVIRGFNQAAAGHPWEIRRGPVDVGFVLHGNHGGAASCRPVSSVALVAAAVANCFPSVVASGDLVRACSDLLGEVDGYELTAGGVAPTADLLLSAVLAGRGSRGR